MNICREKIILIIKIPIINAFNVQEISLVQFEKS